MRDVATATYTTRGLYSGDVHVQGLLSFRSFIFGAVAHHSAPLWQVEVERDEGAVLHAQCTQSRTINLGHKHPRVER